jgi:hypothetical protein
MKRRKSARRTTKAMRELLVAQIGLWRCMSELERETGIRDLTDDDMEGVRELAVVYDDGCPGSASVLAGALSRLRMCHPRTLKYLARVPHRDCVPCGKGAS